MNEKDIQIDPKIKNKSNTMLNTFTNFHPSEHQN